MRQAPFCCDEGLITTADASGQVITTEGGTAAPIHPSEPLFGSGLLGWSESGEKNFQFLTRSIISSRLHTTTETGAKAAQTGECK